MTISMIAMLLAITLSAPEARGFPHQDAVTPDEAVEAFVQWDGRPLD